MKSIESTIRSELPGKDNAGLRAACRKALDIGPGHDAWQADASKRVRLIAGWSALTASGRAAINTIADRVAAEPSVPTDPECPLFS
jgi:hypothetical protein